MKPFNSYQYLEGDLLTERNKLEKDSKFWNEGKWDNFITPLLPKDCKDMTLIDVGCNSGLYLKMAKDWGFRRVIGIEPDKIAYQRAVNYRDKNGYVYELINDKIENCADSLPVADVTLLSNVHYYLIISDWLEYLDRLISKTCYCLIITKHSVDKHYLPLTSIPNTQLYFKNWQEVNSVYYVNPKNDPSPRLLWSFMFKSPILTRTPIEKLYHRGGKLVTSFYQKMDRNENYKRTSYYKYWVKKQGFKDRKLSLEQIDMLVKSKLELFKNVKKNGLMKPIVTRSDGKVIDGTHRVEMARQLGYSSVITRTV